MSPRSKYWAQGTAAAGFSDPCCVNIHQQCLSPFRFFSTVAPCNTSVSRMSAWYHFQMNSRGNFDHLFLWLCPFSSPTTSVHLNVFDYPAVFNQLFGWSCFAQISGHVSFWNGRMDLIVLFFPLTLFKIALLNRSKTCATGKLMIGGSSVPLRSYFRKSFKACILFPFSDVYFSLQTPEPFVTSAHVRSDKLGMQKKWKIFFSHYYSHSLTLLLFLFILIFWSVHWPAGTVELSN